MSKKSAASSAATVSTAATTETGENTAAPKKAAKAPVEMNVVTLTDGRIVEFGLKRKLQKTSRVNAEGKIEIVLDFANGETRTFTLPDALIQKFAAHGAEQKLGDEIAGVDDIDDCVVAMDDLIDRLYEGQWTVKREVNSMAGASVLAKALMEQSGKPMAEVRAFLANKSHAEKVAIRSNAKIAPIVARLEALKNKNKTPGKVVDTDSLLDDLASGNIAPVSTEQPAAATTDEAALAT